MSPIFSSYLVIIMKDLTSKFKRSMLRRRKHQSNKMRGVGNNSGATVQQQHKHLNISDLITSQQSTKQGSKQSNIPNSMQTL